MSLKRSIKWYNSLAQSKGRRETGYFLVEGIRQVNQVAKTSPELIEEIFVLDNRESLPIKRCITVVEEEFLKKISSTKTAASAVALLKIPLQKWDDFRKERGPVLCLEDVQDPGNVGTLIRSAVAFGFKKILLSSGSADPYSPKVVRSTGGCIGCVKFYRSQDIYSQISELKNDGYQVVTADIGGGTGRLKWHRDTIFCLGNEGNGVSDSILELTDEIFTIPFESSSIESLNVSIAGSIGLSKYYERCIYEKSSN